MAPPLFGLRWVPDAQLRPLRYLPNPHPNDDEDDGSEVPTYATDGPSHKLHQSVRSLTMRLADVEESVRQKSEQIRWLKEMTKDDDRRARVSRWMSGPLLRVFAAWKRVTRNAIRSSLEDLEAQLKESTARQREVQAQCDDLIRECGVLTVALERFYHVAAVDRQRANLRCSFRRWGATRLHVRTHRRADAAPFAKLRSEAARAGILERMSGRGLERARRRELCRALRLLQASGVRAKPRRRRAEGLHELLAARAALRLLRQHALRATALARAVRLTASQPKSVRSAWWRWVSEALRHTVQVRRHEAARHEATLAQLQEAERGLAAANGEVQQLQLATSLWGDDEMPQMLQARSRT